MKYTAATIYMWFGICHMYPISGASIALELGSKIVLPVAEAAITVTAGADVFATIWGVVTAIASACSGFVLVGIGIVLVVGVVAFIAQDGKKRNVQYVDASRQSKNCQAVQLTDAQVSQIQQHKRNIEITCYHVSCQSDHPSMIKNPKKWNAIGVVLYQYNGKSDWKMNNIHCKTGYIVVLISDKVIKYQEKENKGVTLHNTCFKMVFGKYPNELKHTLIAGGFSVQSNDNYGPQCVYNSRSLNTGNNNTQRYSFAERDNIHFGTHVMNPLEQKYISYAMENWMAYKKQNTNVSDVPKDGKNVYVVHPDKQ